MSVRKCGKDCPTVAVLEPLNGASLPPAPLCVHQALLTTAAAMATCPTDGCAAVAQIWTPGKGTKLPICVRQALSLVDVL